MTEIVTLRSKETPPIVGDPLKTPHPPLHRLIKLTTGRGRASCPSDPRGACLPPRVGSPACGRVRAGRPARHARQPQRASCRPRPCTSASRPCWKAPLSRWSAGGAGARPPSCPRSCAASCPSTRPPWTSCGSSGCTPRSPPRCWPTSSSSPALCSSTSCWTRVRPGPGALPGDAVHGRGPATGPGCWGQGREHRGEPAASVSPGGLPGLGSGPRGRISAVGLDHGPLHLRLAVTAPTRRLHPCFLSERGPKVD